ncbi:MAG: hypothetical protein WCJ64_13725, partial [Rhodospirillaceae bacterium]
PVRVEARNLNPFQRISHFRQEVLERPPRWAAGRRGRRRQGGRYPSRLAACLTDGRFQRGENLLDSGGIRRCAATFASQNPQGSLCGVAESGRGGDQVCILCGCIAGDDS